MGMHKKTKKLTVDFPIDEFIYLKMACAKQDVTIKEFVTKAVIKSVEDYEDDLDKASIEAARKDIQENGTVSWKEMCDEMGWEKSYQVKSIHIGIE
ncbi:MAG: hypothetical protein H0W88_08345 [Parachlamydiaceae bacterium]|nr:hypothetical protein [Parachlamydiaceae bacterium]